MKPEEGRERKEDLRTRTKHFALKIIHLCSLLSKNNHVQIIGNQLLRSGTSVGANYREACRARSNPDFISKIGIVIQKDELIAIFTTIVKKAKLNNEKK
ncbi:MAG: four helix bundle protein [Nitrospirae bacterium]|nr:four helix bundle protein [Nitrospirota bacterium]